MPVCDYSVNKKCAAMYKSERGRGMESQEVFINVLCSSQFTTPLEFRLI